MIGDGRQRRPGPQARSDRYRYGGIGSDIAVDSADIALVDDEVNELPHLLALSRRMMTTIKINLTFSMVLNFAAILLAMTGILNPVVGAWSTTPAQCWSSSIRLFCSNGGFGG